jgi:ABC-type lipoprotein release transport system permease subunit
MTAPFFGFRPDFVTPAATASSILLAVAAVACLVPARRASRIDPAPALQRQ